MTLKTLLVNLCFYGLHLITMSDWQPFSEEVIYFKCASGFLAYLFRGRAVQLCGLGSRLRVLGVHLRHFASILRVAKLLRGNWGYYAESGFYALDVESISRRWSLFFGGAVCSVQVGIYFAGMVPITWKRESILCEWSLFCGSENLLRES